MNPVHDDEGVAMCQGALLCAMSNSAEKDQLTLDLFNQLCRAQEGKVPISFKDWDADGFTEVFAMAVRTQCISVAQLMIKDKKFTTLPELNLIFARKVAEERDFGNLAAWIQNVIQSRGFFSRLWYG
jgi:hypothetical protein